jgi:Uma2 family endonuclease
MSTTARLAMADYDRLIEDGAFDDIRNRRIELIRGTLHETPLPESSAHEEVVDRLAEWSHLSASNHQVRIRVQNSIGVPPLDSAPQPDLAWVARKSYRLQRPQPDDVLLVIEVSDSSLDYDLGEKADLYAAAGVADNWVVSIPHWQIEVHRSPQNGRYQQRQAYDASETVNPLHFPNLALPVAMLFNIP